VRARKLLIASSLAALIGTCELHGYGTASAADPENRQASATSQLTAKKIEGDYTEQQAKAGKEVFDQVCAVCHGQNLQGGVGPALTGKQFLSVSQFQQLTAWYLFHFMSKHMPLNAPGSLSETQYLDIMAYLLEANGYPEGSHALSPNKPELQAIKIEPQH
jgi:mono/diheme cytochrome c family protein